MIHFESNAGLISKALVRQTCELAIPYRFKKSICKRLIPEFKSGVNFQRDFYGYIYSGNTADHIDRTVFLCGAYEKPLLYFLRDLAKALNWQSASFLDVGANVGNHSLFMSRLVSQVHAFEPNRAAIARLQSGIKKNNIRNINVHEIGLSNKPGVLALFSPEEGNLGTASLSESFRPNTKAIGNVTIAKGDDYIPEQGIENIKIIKVDVESHEKQVIEGLHSTMIKHRPVVLFEMSGETLSKFQNKSSFHSLFPEKYTPYCFISANKSNGKYTVSPYAFNTETGTEDIIMLPQEYTDRLAL